MMQQRIGVPILARPRDLDLNLPVSLPRPGLISAAAFATGHRGHRRFRR